MTLPLPIGRTTRLVCRDAGVYEREAGVDDDHLCTVSKARPVSGCKWWRWGQWYGTSNWLSIQRESSYNRSTTLPIATQKTYDCGGWAEHDRTHSCHWRQSDNGPYQCNWSNRLAYRGRRANRSPRGSGIARHVIGWLWRLDGERHYEMRRDFTYFAYNRQRAVPRTL